MTDSEHGKKSNIRRPRYALVFGIFCATVYLAVVKMSPGTASLTEITAGCLFIGVLGLASWIWSLVAVFFVALVVATLLGSQFWVYGVNWPNAGALLLPCLVPFVLFAVPDTLRWLKSQEGGMAG